MGTSICVKGPRPATGASARVDGLRQLGPPAREEALDPAAADVVGRRHDGPVELRGVALDVPPRAGQALLLAVEEDEADRAARGETEPPDLAGEIDHEGDVAAVVEGAGPQAPGVQMGADDDKLLRLRGALDLGDDVVAFVGPAGGEVQRHRQLQLGASP